MRKRVSPASFWRRRPQPSEAEWSRRIATDRVEDDMDVPQFFFKRHRLVIDNLIRAEPLYELKVVCRHSARYVCPARVRQLDGKDCDASHSAMYQHARSPGSALELGTSQLRIYHRTGIYRHIHSRNADVAAIVDFDLDDGRHVGQKTAVRRDVQTTSFSQLPLAHPA